MEHINADKDDSAMSHEIPDKNLFMMCKALNPSAVSELSKEYHVRTCRKDELDLWKGMPFDDAESAKEYHGFMTEFFNDVYGEKEDLFFQKCLFVCDTGYGILPRRQAHGA